MVQWFWKTAVFPDDDQWNSIHEKLVARWRVIGDLLPKPELHFTWSSADTSGEDHVTITYLQETAAEGGLDTVGLAIEDIGWDPVLKRFVDLAEAPMQHAGQALSVGVDGGRPVRPARRQALPATMWIEPLWKMLLSNKALLAVLWEMHPGHPNLLPAFLDSPGMLTEYVRKPKLGREGGEHPDRRAGPRGRPPAACTARKATCTNCSTRCPSSTATGPRWVRGSSPTRRPDWASARRPGWSPTTAPRSCRTASWAAALAHQRRVGPGAKRLVSHDVDLPPAGALREAATLTCCDRPEDPARESGGGARFAACPWRGRDAGGRAAVRRRAAQGRHQPRRRAAGRAEAAGQAGRQGARRRAGRAAGQGQGTGRRGEGGRGRAERGRGGAAPRRTGRVSNVVEEGAPAGGEDDYVVLKHVGDVPEFDFEPRDHLRWARGCRRSTWSAARRCPAPGSTSCAAWACNWRSRC